MLVAAALWPCSHYTGWGSNSLTVVGVGKQKPRRTALECDIVIPAALTLDLVRINFAIIIIAAVLNLMGHTLID